MSADILREQIETFDGAVAGAEYYGHYAPEFVPGLLQTEAYRRATTVALQRWSGQAPVIEQSHRHNRLDALRDNGARLEIYIGEAALNRQVGSRADMWAQMDHLAEVAAETGVVRVVPFELPTERQIVTPDIPAYMLTRHIVEGEARDTLWLDDARMAVTSGETLSRVQRFHEALGGVALSPQESVELIESFT